MIEHFVGEILVDDDHAGAEVCRYTGKSKTIFSRLNLEVGIGKYRRHRAQQHGSNEDRHRWNTLRHDDYNSIASAYAMIEEERRLHARPPAKFAEGHGFALVFVEPRGNKRTSRGSTVEGVNEGAIFGRNHAGLNIRDSQSYLSLPSHAKFI